MNMYFKIEANFTVSNDENFETTVITQFKEKKPDTLEILARFKDNRALVGTRSDYSFYAQNEDIKSGEMIIIIDGDNLRFKCNAIFNIDLRANLEAQHVPDCINAILNPKIQRYFEGIKGCESKGSGIFLRKESIWCSDPSGLNAETYKWETFTEEGESLRYIIPVKVAREIEDLL